MQNWTKIIKTNVKGGHDRKKNPVYSICAFNYNHKMQNHIPHFKSIRITLIIGYKAKLFKNQI